MGCEVRLVCETEVGDGKGWHYWREHQDTFDDAIPCATHPSADTRDLIIEKENT